MSNLHDVRTPQRPDAEPPDRGTSLLLTLVVLVVLVPGVSVAALALLVRAVAAGWGPALAGGLLAGAWPLLAGAWREVTGAAPPRLAGLPGWVWLGLLGAALCALLL